MAQYYESRRPPPLDARSHRSFNCPRRSRDLSPRRDERRSYIVQDARNAAYLHDPYRPEDYFNKHRYTYSYYGHRPVRRQSWPIYSFVEDEKASLAKEAFPPIPDSETIEVHHRGSVDQQPVILPAGLKSEDIIEENDSSVDDDSDSDQEDKACPPGPTITGNSGDRTTKRAPIPDKIVDLTKMTEYVKDDDRHVDRHVVTPPFKDPRASPTDSGYCSSTDLLAEKRRQARVLNDIAASDALRGQGKLREGQRYRPASWTGPENNKPSEDQQPYHEDKGSRLPPSSYPDSPRKEIRQSRRNSTRRPRLDAIKADALHAPRRSSDTADTLPRQTAAGISRSYSMSKASTASALAVGTVGAVTAGKASQSSSETSSRSSSPAPTPSTGSSSPAHSPAPTNRKPRDEIRSLRSRSGHRSRAASPTGPSERYEPHAVAFESRPPLTMTCSDPGPRSKSKVRSKSRQRPAGALARTAPSSPTTELPYPEEERGMSAIHSHEYFPSLEDGIPFPSPAPFPTEQVSPDMEQRVDEISMPPTRPELATRHTTSSSGSSRRLTVRFADEPLYEPAPIKTPSYRPPSPPPPCNRSKASTLYDDWYTLEGLSDFDICPDCYYDNFDPTMFRVHFRRAKAKSLRQKTRCDFSNSWIRLAWIMTQQRQLHDLDLMYSVARIGLREGCCPNDHEDERSWYTLVDKKGQEVSNFNVCKTDVRRIEALLPQMHNRFRKKYDGYYKVRKCDLRMESHRFREYLRTLDKISETSEISYKAPDVQPFIKYAQSRAQVDECSGKELVFNKKWHIMHQLPELTICRECYSDFVVPLAEDNYPLAGKVSKRARTLENQKTGKDEGHVCKLHCKIRRTIFTGTIKENDLDSLEAAVFDWQDEENLINNKKRESNGKQLQKYHDHDAGSASQGNGLLDDFSRMAHRLRK